jgi:hypothetical protein
MAARVVVAGVILVIIVAMLVFTVEFFLPLSAKTDMNICCRNAMLRMEIEGGLSAGAESQLRSDLSARGFVNIQVYGTTAAKQGSGIPQKNVNKRCIFASVSRPFHFSLCAFIEPRLLVPFLIIFKVLPHNRHTFPV